MIWQESTVAEWIASLACSQRVVGSNPGVGALYFLAFFCYHVAEIGVTDDRVVVAGVTGQTTRITGVCVTGHCVMGAHVLTRAPLTLRPVTQTPVTRVRMTRDTSNHHTITRDTNNGHRITRNPSVVSEQCE